MVQIFLKIEQPAREAAFHNDSIYVTGDKEMLPAFPKNLSLLILPRDEQHFDLKTNTRHPIRKGDLGILLWSC